VSEPCWSAIARCHLLTQPEHAIAHEPDRISKASRVRGEHGRTARVPAGAAHREQRREVEAAEGNSFKSLSRLIASAKFTANLSHSTVRILVFQFFVDKETGARCTLRCTHSTALHVLVVVLSCRGHLPFCRTRSGHVSGLRCCNCGDVCTICVI
jgi:hypothetical protein